LNGLEKPQNIRFGSVALTHAFSKIAGDAAQPDEEVVIFYRNTTTNHLGLRENPNKCVILTNKGLYHIQDSKIDNSVLLSDLIGVEVLARGIFHFDQILCSTNETQGNPIKILIWSGEVCVFYAQVLRSVIDILSTYGSLTPGDANINCQHSDSPNDSINHKFVQEVLTEPSWCAHCQEFIWFLAIPGSSRAMKCKACHITVHRWYVNFPD